MALPVDSTIEVFDSIQNLDDTSATVTAGSFSVAGDLLQFTNVEDALYAAVVLRVTFSVASAANRDVTLYARPMDITGTEDQDVPSADLPHTRVGVFPINTGTSLQIITLGQVPLPNIETNQLYEFYIRNNTDQTITAGWNISITAKATAPHA